MGLARWREMAANDVDFLVAAGLLKLTNPFVEKLAIHFNVNPDKFQDWLDANGLKLDQSQASIYSFNRLSTGEDQK